jgi:hypothetical protein
MKIIISENQVDKIKSKIHEYVKKYGFEKCREIFGDKVLFTIGFNNDPMEFLNLFNDLDVVQSGHRTFFRDENNKILISHEKRREKVWVDYWLIWSVLEKGFGLDQNIDDKLIKKWLNKTYKIRNVEVSGIYNLDNYYRQH